MSGPRCFPLAAVVGQPLVVEALLLLAVDPGLGGVVIAGRRGSGKSVLARGLQELLPPIRVIQGSCCQADPTCPSDWDDATIARRALLSRNPPSHWIPSPFVQVPLGVSEDRLLGSVDVTRSIGRGEAVFQPGLLAEAHRGVLYIDELNLLEPHIANLLLSTVAEGVNRVEREGISFQHPCRPLLIATYNPVEGELRSHLIDRFAIALSTDIALALPQRVEAVERVLQSAEAPMSFAGRYAAAQQALREQIAAGRRHLRRVRVQSQQVRYLVEEASRAGCEGQRAELFAVRVARAHAALHGRRSVEASDLRRAVELVILPRALLLPAQPPPPSPEARPEPQPPEPQPEDQREDQAQQPPEPPPEPTPGGLPEFVLSPEGVLLDPALLAFSALAQRRHGKGSGGGVIWSQERGRYVKPVFPHGEIHRVAIDATLRAAAPFQKRRRRRHRSNSRHRASKGRIWIEDGDLRVKRLARKAGSLVVFVVDASGSMALHRMQAAKGAVLRLLEQAYRHRDQIALIVFRGERAEVQLRFTPGPWPSPGGASGPQCTPLQRHWRGGDRADQRWQGQCELEPLPVPPSTGPGNGPAAWRRRPGRYQGRTAQHCGGTPQQTAAPAGDRHRQPLARRGAHPRPGHSGRRSLLLPAQGQRSRPGRHGPRSPAAASGRSRLAQLISRETSCSSRPWRSSRLRVPQRGHSHTPWSATKQASQDRHQQRAGTSSITSSAPAAMLPSITTA